MRGKFIVIYGPNNIGKTTQAKLLVKKFRKNNFKVKLLKYPVYDLKPTGPKLYKLLRTKTTIAEENLQKIFTQNRIDFEPKLKKMLESGWNIVAEDYKGTGICWGVTNGVSLGKMEKMNKGLLKENLAILLDGKRFRQAKERGHRNEDGGRWNLSRRVHLRLGKKYGWKKVNANLHKDVVSKNIWKIVEKVID
jgi:thymidylate kinase